MSTERSRAWVEFVAAALSKGETVGKAEDYADGMLKAYDSRFPEEGAKTPPVCSVKEKHCCFTDGVNLYHTCNYGEDFSCVTCGGSLKVEDTGKKWKPEIGETFFWPCFTQESLLMKYSWSDDTDDNRLFNLGLCCRTPEQARNLALKMLDAIK